MEKTQEEITFKSVEDLVETTKRWGDIEQRAGFVAALLMQLKKEETLPTNFIIDAESRNIRFVYSDNLVRDLPLEILLFVPDASIIMKIMQSCFELEESLEKEVAGDSLKD